MVRNVKLLTWNAKLCLKTLSFAEAQNINSDPHAVLIRNVSSQQIKSYLKPLIIKVHLKI